MKRLTSILPCFLLLFTLCPSLCLSNPCSQSIVRAMQEEGLTDQQITLICKKAELYEGLSSDEPTDVYARAKSLFDQEKYADAIAELEPFCQDNPNQVKGKILLAKAYLEECDKLKAAGDDRYKGLVMKPYYIGKSLIAGNAHVPDVLYICARSFLINNRARRANKYINKAINMSVNAPAKYYITLGDACVKRSSDKSNEMFKDSIIADAKKAYETALSKADKKLLRDEILVKLAALY
jgi:hypothetical protein